MLVKGMVQDPTLAPLPLMRREGALDLFECVLQAKLGIAAARIDGDMDAKTARTPVA